VGDRTVALVASSQAAYLGGLALCLALDPGVVTHGDEGGISNFGVHAATVAPYTAAFLAAAALLAAAAAVAPPHPRARRLALALRALALSLVCVLASTYAYRHAPWLRDLHVAVAIAASVVEIAVAAWLVAVCRDAVSALSAGAFLACAALEAVTLAGALHVLFAAQAGAAVAFAVLLVHGARAATRRGATAPAAA
jgi:hypothetical protein